MHGVTRATEATWTDPSVGCSLILHSDVGLGGDDVDAGAAAAAAAAAAAYATAAAERYDDNGGDDGDGGND